MNQTPLALYRLSPPGARPETARLWAVRSDAVSFRIGMCGAVPTGDFPGTYYTGHPDRWDCPPHDAVAPLLHAASLGDGAAAAALSDLLREMDAPEWVAMGAAGDPGWWDAVPKPEPFGNSRFPADYVRINDVSTGYGVRRSLPAIDRERYEAAMREIEQMRQQMLRFHSVSSPSFVVPTTYATWLSGSTAVAFQSTADEPPAPAEGGG